MSADAQCIQELVAFVPHNLGNLVAQAVDDLHTPHRTQSSDRW
jgi:hypothetical protein